MNENQFFIRKRNRNREIYRNLKLGKPFLKPQKDASKATSDRSYE